MTIWGRVFLIAASLLSSLSALFLVQLFSYLLGCFVVLGGQIVVYDPGLLSEALLRRRDRRIRPFSGVVAHQMGVDIAFQNPPIFCPYTVVFHLLAS